MVKIGQVAIKTAGRDAGKACIVVEILENNYVTIDGQTRRKKCNTEHLFFLNKETKLKKGASTEEAQKALKELGFETETKSKKKDKKEKTSKPKKLRKSGKTNEAKAETKKLEEKKKSEKPKAKENK